MAYATLDELIDRLDLGDKSVNETLMQEKLTEAQEIIERITGRSFEAESDETRFIDYVVGETIVDNRRSLWLDDDLCQITSITNGDGVELAVANYVTEPRLRTISGGGCLMPATPAAWPWYKITIKMSSGIAWTYESDIEEAISIVGRWAFSVTPPEPIKGATIHLADWLYSNKDTISEEKETVVNKTGTMLLMADLPQAVQLIISKYIKNV